MKDKEIIDKVEGAIGWIEQRTPFTIYQRELVRMQFIHSIRQLIIPDVSKSVVCGNCDGWGYTVDENGRRKEHCKECE